MAYTPRPSIPLTVLSDWRVIGQTVQHIWTWIDSFRRALRFDLEALQSMMRLVDQHWDTDVLTGMGVTLDSGTTYDIAAGTYKIGGFNYSYAGGSITLDAATSGYSRFDAITINRDGTVAAVEGEESYDPYYVPSPAEDVCTVGVVLVDNRVAKVTQVLFAAGGGWNQSHLVMGSYHIWVDSTGDLRIKSSAPSSDLDGTVVGTQV